jgi:hypothetical protein
MNPKLQVSPKGSLNIYLKAASYIGASVTGANVSLSLSTPRTVVPLYAITNGTGEAEVAVDLGALEEDKAVRMGDALMVRGFWAQWVQQSPRRPAGALA